MTSLRRIRLLTLVLAIYAPIARAQTTVAITEPRIFTLQSLFAQADTVALVKIVAGDTENYGVTVYKATVAESFKGPVTGEVIYFGPHAGRKIGSGYVVFLQNTATPKSPKTNSTSSYGTIRYSVDFDEGYTTMETSYGCVFPGKVIAERCDDGVRVCTDYITLPRSTALAPPISEETDFGCRWARNREFLALLRGLRGDGKR